MTTSPSCRAERPGLLRALSSFGPRLLTDSAECLGNSQAVALGKKSQEPALEALTTEENALGSRTASSASILRLIRMLDCPIARISRL